MFTLAPGPDRADVSAPVEIDWVAGDIGAILNVALHELRDSGSEPFIGDVMVVSCLDHGQVFQRYRLDIDGMHPLDVE